MRSADHLQTSPVERMEGIVNGDLRTYGILTMVATIRTST